MLLFYPVSLREIFGHYGFVQKPRKFLKFICGLLTLPYTNFWKSFKTFLYRNPFTRFILIHRFCSYTMPFFKTPPDTQIEIYIDDEPQLEKRMQFLKRLFSITFLIFRENVEEPKIRLPQFIFCVAMVFLGKFYIRNSFINCLHFRCLPNRLSFMEQNWTNKWKHYLWFNYCHLVHSMLCLVVIYSLLAVWPFPNHVRRWNMV